MYLAYEPISKKPDATTFVPPELFEAQQQAKKTLPASLTKNWDDWVAKEIGFDSKENLWDNFSSEQIDSIGLVIYNFENGQNFIIADETGIGKGRILSGICRWALMHNKKVMFFTEREHLFSDFWRDLNDTKTIDLLSNPIVFHSSSKVYYNDEVVLRGTKKIVTQIQNDGFDDDTNFVMTNYSQINLKQHKKTKKDAMVEFCRDNIIILDECHNATGDSATRKFLLSLTDVSKNIIYSSATFMKDESQLDLYEKTISFDADTIELFKRLLRTDQELILRKIFTYELTRKLQFWRREHQPLDVGWKSIVCENLDEQSQYIDKYSEIINKLFELSNAISKEPSLAHLELNGSWFALGATINRLSRNLLLLLKIDALIQGVKDTIARDRKAVIVIDSTFSSIINKVIENQSNIIENSDDDDENEHIEADENENYELNFKQVLFYIIEEIAGKYIKEYGNSISEYLKDDYELLRQEAAFFQNLQISPIDMIINQLGKENIPCNEISGRTVRVNQEGKLEKILKQPKAKLVSEFNSGLKDVIIITRAGASGLSLHASAVFKDQRVRELFELEITNRPTYRLQFIGRVNRKNQVVQPEFYTVITKLPFEQRILNVEQQKLKKMQSHISGDDEKMSQENIHNFYTNYCNDSIYQFLKNHGQLAYQMGIGMKEYNQEPFFYVDSILKRCIVLNSVQQNFLYDYLIYCTECEIKINSRRAHPNKITSGGIKTFWHQLDQVQQQEFKKQFGNLPNMSINQFKFPWVGLMEIESFYSTNTVFDKNLINELNKNLASAPEAQDYVNKLIQHYSSSKLYDRQYIFSTIIPRLQSLKIGKCISIKTIEGNIFGYVNEITFPKIPKNYQYDNLGLIQIKTINPHLHESIVYQHNEYYLTFKEFIEMDNITVYETPIDWSKFNRPKKEYSRKSYCFIGHPVYMEFLKQSYKIGEIRYYDFGGRKNMCILLPHTLKSDEIMKLYKPIYKANKIMEGLIAKKIKGLTTVWQDDNNIKPSLKLEPTTGGYNLYIASEVSRDVNFVDFPLRKKLNSHRRGSASGFDLFFLPYKDVRYMLLLLEARDVIWFIKENI